jgi:hypothetical protein
MEIEIVWLGYQTSSIIMFLKHIMIQYNAYIVIP